LRILLAALLALVLRSYARAEYTLFRLGLYDSAFTASTGRQFSVLARTSGTFAFGYSLKFTGTSTIGRGAWVANATTGTTTRIGFFDAGYTQVGGSQNGFQFSFATLFQGGFAAGYSTKFSGANNIGQAAWVANASTGLTVRVGLVDSGFTDSVGGQSSTVLALDSGYAAGVSNQYSGFTDRGQAAWVANATTGATIRVGLTDANYTQTGGYQASNVDFLQGGWAAGYSAKYSAGGYLGQAAWVANASCGDSIRVGLFDAPYTQSSGTIGYQNSGITGLSGSYVVGYSMKYSGATYLGQAAFVAVNSTGTTTRVGYTDSLYTQSGGTTPGYQYSAITHLQGSWLAGYSTKYLTTVELGQAAWVAPASTGTLTRVGFFDSIHTQTSGAQYSSVQFLQNGFAAGYSLRYSSSTDLGRTAWIANAATGITTRVGLTGTAFIQSGGAQNGYQYSNVQLLSGAYAAGTSTLYSGTVENGEAVWVAGALSGSTARIGLTDAQHTRNDGSQTSTLSFLADTPYIAGASKRYRGATQVGQTAWIYDIDDGIFSPIVLSLRTTDTYAYSSILRLYDTGLAVGQYTLFSTGGLDLGLRAFAWTPTDGAFDLASAVTGGLSATGWSLLAEADYADPVTRTIFGYGDLIGEASGTQAVYGAIPEPSSLTLLALGAGLCTTRRRRRK
jgi:hypothetical protein